MVSPDRQLNLLHLGDSYTCAEGIDPSGGWVLQWHDRLKGQGIEVAQTRIIAKNGWTCEDLLEAVGKSELTPEWDRITLCIGVNNQYRGMKMQTFGAQLEHLIREATRYLRNPPNGLILLSIPDWGVSPFAADRDRVAIAAEVDAFNSVILRVSIKTVCPFLNWTGLSRTFAGQPEAFAQDRLHPSALQYSAWADFLAQSKLGC